MLLLSAKQDKKTQIAGRGAVGGPFTLTDTTGHVRTEADLVGHWSLLYFGFTHCPDICPTELEKLATALNALGMQIMVHHHNIHMPCLQTRPWAP